MTEKIIYAKWLAEELTRQGFPFIEVRPNPERPEFDCWVFINSIGLRNAMARLTSKRKNDKLA